MVIHKLTNNSRGTDNQAPKTGQLLEYNFKKHFPWKIIHRM